MRRLRLWGQASLQIFSLPKRTVVDSEKLRNTNMHWFFLKNLLDDELHQIKGSLGMFSEKFKGELNTPKQQI